jgi:hypothetical protein
VIQEIYFHSLELQIACGGGSLRDIVLLQSSRAASIYHTKIVAIPTSVLTSLKSTSRRGSVDRQCRRIYADAGTNRQAL